MKKFVLSFSFLLLGISYASASSCVDLQSNLSWGKENADVLKLQTFLFQKGFLTANPNGYYGNGTLSAVKKYQKSVGLSASGGVLSLTRNAIKQETCVISSGGVSTQTLVNGCTSQQGFSTVNGASCSVVLGFPEGCSSSVGFSITTGMSCGQNVTVIKNTVPTSSPVVVAPATISKVPTTSNNQKRQDDVKKLLSAMYAFYRDSHGRFPIPTIATTSIEICTLGISLCDKFNEVKSSLVPNFLDVIPMDPTLASSTGSGYFITRLEDGTITVSAPKADLGASILASCNFYSGCSIKTALDIVIGKPYIESIDKAIFLSGGNMDASLKIHGKDFDAASNTIMLSLQGGRKIFTVGVFPSVDGVSIAATSSFTNQPFSCGENCLEKLPIGGYDVIVRTAKGDSNVGFISLQSITAKSVSNSLDKPFIPKSTHVKLGTVTLSSQALVALKSLSFTIQGTSSLISKVTNFTITDAITGKVINGGLNFTLPEESISNYATKIYELYANIADIDNSYAGRLDIDGSFVVAEAISKTLVTVPFPKFTITISY
jgi:peptidoglycan hydrolase-like protein with peptidoglycan-binding domain